MIYVVEPGDSVDSIAQTHAVSVSDLIYINQLSYPYPLAVGQALLLPEQDGVSPSMPVVTNGYAYPFIQPEILRNTLPYLTCLSVFSYGFTVQGTLLPPAADPLWMISLAREAGVQPILTLTPLDENGKFNNQIIHEVVNSTEAQNTLIQNLLLTLEQQGYQGVDIDFEYIPAQDRDAFTTFVAGLTEQLNASGYETSVALAPKTSSDQKGLLYEGKDYGGLGAAANAVLLMTYEWGYTYGPPMAVAPIHKVREVVEYAITQIPRTKIILGIPNYGYAWPLPYERGVTKATTLGNIQAVELAVRQHAVIEFDETAQAPYFRYTENGVEHEVWFEDVRSMQAKFDLVQEFSLRGMGYWQLMRFFRANWLLLERQFLII